MVSRCLDVWRGVVLSAQQTTAISTDLCKSEFDRRRTTWANGKVGEVIDPGLMHDYAVAAFAFR